MVAGLPLETFTSLHVIISLTGVLTGIVAMIGMAAGRRAAGVSLVFLTTTLLTSLTGFLYPANTIGIRHLVGVASLVLLTVAMIALYVARLRGTWRLAYVGAALVALWFNTSAAVVQAFRKISVLSDRIGDDTEGCILASQVVLGGVFLLIGIVAFRRGPSVPLMEQDRPTTAQDVVLRVPSIR